MLTKHIALISETQHVPLSQVALIAAALQKQVVRDFSPIWNVDATVAAFNSLNEMPVDYWPIIIMDDIRTPGAAGIHLSEEGQPYALVDSTNDVSLTCSHELLEMLVDPSGNRLIAGRSLNPDQDRVNFLVEVCDPSETYGYFINGIHVSDFYTPDFFAPVASSGIRYSFMGVIPGPRTIMPGGYITWMVPETNEWWQQNYFGAKPVLKNLGMLKLNNGKCWREIIDSNTRAPKKKLSAETKPKSIRSTKKEHNLHRQIKHLLKNL